MIVDYELMTLSATTSSGASATSTGTYNGFLHAVRYTIATNSTDRLSTGGRLTLTGDRTGFALFILEDLGSTADGLYFPRMVTVLSTDAVTASTGSAMPPVFNERLTASISSGSTGGTKTGTLGLYFV